MDDARLMLTRYWLRCVNRRQRIEGMLAAAREREQAALRQISDFDANNRLSAEQLLAGANVARRRNIVKGRVRRG